ncbi:MAG: hypothetical protein RBG1_1C00001G1632 [candidate division Zixibacteria bacterium RBG-1]|nr:MAG: hypothetical protein RBG1_1C00001G1632 [candidate division Zixibacteria bacterium RBG-1]OGC86618.1 MAG: hypothetical protein A2V73_07285 [candidate division Zixibacteria bacterium RBG_19FT_COMBO_42_43]
MGGLKKYDIPGQAYFITTCTFRRKKIFQNEKCCQILLDNLEFYRKKFGFKLVGYVIMPDHLQCVVLPKTRTTASEIMRDFKKFSAKQISEYLKQNDSSKKKAKIYNIWQDGFYAFNLDNQDKLNEKLNYIHSDPVRNGLVSDMEDYKFSSYLWYTQEKGPIEIDQI